MVRPQSDLTVEQKPIVVFDAQCVLCSASARFILRHDKRLLFRLASIQGITGNRLCLLADEDPADPLTMFVYMPDAVLRQSDAVLFIASQLGLPWSVLGILRLVPRALRDSLYRLVARNRYSWFGRHDRCELPAPEHASRILD